MMLQSKFEQDKKRIQELRAARKFRPYWAVHNWGGAKKRDWKKKKQAAEVSEVLSSMLQFCSNLLQVSAACEFTEEISCATLYPGTLMTIVFSDIID